MTDEDLLDKAKRRHASASSPLRDERKQVLDDIRFCYVSGAQWEGKIGEQFENKLRLEVNKVMMAQTRIDNEYRQNDISISVIPKNGTTDKQSDFVAGLLRADNQDCVSSEAFDCAYRESSCGGYGAFRLRSEIEDEYNDDDDHQRVTWESIPDAANSVYFDPGAKRQDKADARWGIVITALDREEYKDIYDDDPTDWPDTLATYGFDWESPDVVRIAEYYECEEKKEKYYCMKSLTGEILKLDADEYEDQIEELEATGYQLDEEKMIRTKKVHKWILSGGKILEDCGIIAGSNIPVVEVFGKRIIIDSIERTMGHVRFAKDAQRLKNMQLSMLGETAVLSPREKPIFTGAQVKGHEATWAQDNIENYAYSLVNPIEDKDGNLMPMGPLGYTKTAMIAPATAALLQITEQDMADILGRGGATDEVVSGVSGKAIELIQSRIDGIAYGYLDNLGKAKKRGSEIWWSMAQDIYVEDGREMKTIDKADNYEATNLMTKEMGEEGEIYTNDLSKLKVEFSYEIGPSSESKRASTSRNVLGMMQVSTDPQAMALLSSLLLYNIEGEGMGDVREFARKQLVTLGAMTPTEEDLAEQAEQPQEPSANDKYLEAEAERATAEAAEKRANTVNTIADAELKRAQAAKIQAETMASQNQQAPQAVDVPKTYDEEKLLLEAQKVRSANALKSREIAIKEKELVIKQKEMALKLAEKLADSSESQEETEQIEQAKGSIEVSPDNALEKLVTIMEAQQVSRDKALETLSKPKKVIREDGKIVGIE